MFQDSDFEWLSIIQCLKKTGMPIKEIKYFIDWCIEGDSTIDQRLALIDRQRETVLHQLKQIQDTLDMLDYKHWYYETAKEAGTCDVHKTMAEADIPEKYHAVIKKAKELDAE